MGNYAIRSLLRKLPQRSTSSAEKLQQEEITISFFYFFRGEIKVESRWARGSLPKRAWWPR